MEHLAELDWANQQYTSLEELSNTIINQEDTIFAQGIKIRVAKIIVACLKFERTRPMIRLIGKFYRLEFILTKFILLELRKEYVEIDPDDEIPQ